MSHVRRKRPRQPQRKGAGSIPRKRESKRAWYSFGLAMILFISVMAAILIAILTTES